MSLSEQLGFRKILAFGLATVALVLLADFIFFGAGYARWLVLCLTLLAGSLGWKLWR
jgi:hypothetical protein